MDWLRILHPLPLEAVWMKEGERDEDTAPRNIIIIMPRQVIDSLVLLKLRPTVQLKGLQKLVALDNQENTFLECCLWNGCWSRHRCFPPSPDKFPKIARRFLLLCRRAVIGRRDAFQSS
jgi:hypothetical protein